MVVKRILRRRPHSMRPSLPDLVLPEERTELCKDLSRFIILFYGREGIGKTTAMAGFPRACYFPFEPGVLGVQVYDFFHANKVEPSWYAFRGGVDLLVADAKQKPRRFATAVVDTGDRAYDLCSEYICETRGIAHVSEDETGKSDRSGKGWTALRKEFTEQLYRLRNAGYGVVLASHSRTNEIESSSGTVYNQIAPSLSGQAFGIIRALADFIVYMDYVRNSKGELRRVMITSGDELIVSKHRGYLPRFLPLPDPAVRTAYDVILKAFRREEPGLDPKTFTAARSAAKETRQVLLQSADEVRKAKTRKS
jgi:hypothetical protein